MLGVLAQIKAEKDSVDALIQPVETADRLFQEMQALQKQVNELESKLDVQAQGAKSLEEIISELKILEKKRSVVKEYPLSPFSKITTNFCPIRRCLL